LFDYPNITGTVVRDMASASMIWPIEALFAGPDNDLLAEKFGDALQQQNGEWLVTHPIYGTRGLTLMRWVETFDRMESDGITVFETTWIEGIDPSTLLTTAQMTDAVGVRADLMDVSAADQFVANASLNNLGEEFSLSGALEGIAEFADKILGPVAALNTDIYAEFNSIQRGINSVLDSTIVSAAQIGGQFQALIQTPLKATDSIQARLDAYFDFADEMNNIKPTSKDLDGRNVAAAQELAVTSVISSNARIAATTAQGDIVPAVGGMRTRGEVVNTASKIVDKLNDMIATMDESQVFFEDSPIEVQYFSQSQSMAISNTLTMEAAQYLIQASLNLKRERVIKLRRPSTAVLEAIRRYGTPGPNDEYIDLFIDSNQLAGREILYLPPGREIVVYV
jgi:hypothetical protein